ncbi:MAG: UDP-N-acetylmuramate dehydrogenase [Oscillospiraceae bacterium]|nr:UDP-N-acetylmuramate dehydrogenase [Oscillospiraceae bacterium]
MDKFSSVIRNITQSLPQLKLRENEPMKDHTSFKIGGPVRVMFFPETAQEVVCIYDLLTKAELPSFILGNGTNLLVSDERMELAVINTMGLSLVKRTGAHEISAGAGVKLSKLAMFACQCGLSGLEFARGIPGSLGGAVYMNAGAYGGEMKDVVCNTVAYGFELGLQDIVGDAHDFSYRHSRFLFSGEAVLSSIIRLQEDDVHNIRTKMDEFSVRRRESQPLDLPSAGSVFKRPKDGYAGSMIEKAGLKGYRVGGAMVSEKHAGFIVNSGGASFSDVLGVIEHVKETVCKQFGVMLETEIKIIS